MIEELQRFLLVAKEGNLTRTAEKIFITQSALTQSIHRLEKELQTKLFQQQGKQLQLTKDGKALIILGEKIVQLWTQAHDPAIRNAKMQTIAVGLFDNVALRLGKFLQANLQSESYRLEITIDSSSKLLKQLQLGTLDVVLCILSKNYQLPDHLTLIKAYTEKLVPVSAKKFSGTIDTLPFILYNRGSHTREQIDELFRKNNIHPTIYAESTSVTFMRELALLGSGVALLPENFIKQDLDQGSLKKIPMPIKWQRAYGLYTTKITSLLTPFVKDLINELEK